MALHALPLAAGMAAIDLQFMGQPHAIATAVVLGPGSVALVDPGPTSCLDTLELGLNGIGVRLADVTDILLTHIHLDHAGATGTIVRRHPHIRVHVHQRGAPHLIDPAKLLASATRLYGAAMGRLWGEVATVPAGRLNVLSGGEGIEAGGRRFDVAYTPGHASHHVSYFNRDSGIAFVGDTAGVCVDGGYVLPPTPPPDIDIESWRDSIARIDAWGPDTLFLTHFGTAPSVRPHLQTLLDNLTTLAAHARALLTEPGSDEDRGVRFAEYLQRDLRRRMTAAQVESYRAAAMPNLLWLGLARYWRKRGISSAP